MMKKSDFGNRSVFASYPFELRGLGHQTLKRQRGFKGSKIGAANSGRTLSERERADVERKLRAEGKI